MPKVVRDDAADILKKYLADHGIKNKYLADKIGMSESQLSSLLYKRSLLNGDKAILIAKALGISPNVFLKESYKF